MSFDWIEYFKLAQELKLRPLTNQAAMRSAISRAYYAGYNKAAAKMQEDTGKPLAGGDTHKQVWDYFEKASDLYRRRIGNDGTRLKRRRVDADYHADREVRENDLEDAFIKAEKILGLLPRLTRSGPH